MSFFIYGYITESTPPQLCGMDLLSWVEQKPFESDERSDDEIYEASGGRKINITSLDPFVPLRLLGRKMSRRERPGQAAHGLFFRRAFWGDGGWLPSFH